jgi:hypothetical protein
VPSTIRTWCLIPHAAFRARGPAERAVTSTPVTGSHCIAIQARVRHPAADVQQRLARLQFPERHYSHVAAKPRAETRAGVSA